MRKTVSYKGIYCWLTTDWALGKPVVQIKKAKDISKALSLGFECIGFPNEIVKFLTAEEYEILSNRGIIED